jgi:hypothetical protein
MSLEQGETNNDIKKIQKLLATDPLIYPYGVSSGFFGPKTEEGIKNFQTRFGLNAVGVVGPATRDLLELFFLAYPDDIYPEGVLKKKPTVLGASISIPSAPVTAPVASPVTTVQSGKALKSITAKYDGDEAEVSVHYTDGTKERHTLEGSSKMQIIDALAAKLSQKKAAVLSTIEFVSKSNDEDEDDEDKESDEIESITAKIANGEAEIEVEYENGDDEDFTVEETVESEIIEEVADELNIDEDEVEDIIEFEYEDIERIDVTIDEDEGTALAIVRFEDGTKKRIRIDSDDEDEIIEELADELDEDEDDIEDWVEFD